MSAREPMTFRCHVCQGPMTKVLEVVESAEGPCIEVYQCGMGDCKRKIDVIFEPAGGLTEEQKSWVEREVARTGAFFPSDYTGGMGGAGALRRP